MRRRFFNSGSPLDKFLAIELLEECRTVQFNNYTVNTIEYSYNGGTWVPVPEDGIITNNNELLAPVGELIYFKGDIGTTFPVISVDCHFNALGNIMGMFAWGEGSNRTMNENMTLRAFFANSLVVNTYDLLLPAIELTDFCYASMFYNCQSLISTPSLPATTLASNCYFSMFDSCNSLIIAPELPATTLAESCYQYMFNGCNSLIIAPELPATILADSCYYGMFEDCNSLIIAPELPATTLASDCYRGMFKDCSSLIIAPEVPVTTLVSNCYQSMFEGCSNLTIAPELPATTLANSCYAYMFKDCTQLQIAPLLFAPVLSQSCYYNMFYNCEKLCEITMLATDTIATDCLKGWTKGVDTNGDFFKANTTYSLPNNENGIPPTWKVNGKNQYLQTYLTFVALTAGDFSFRQHGTGDPIQYSLDNGVTWHHLNEYESVSVGAGDRVLWKSAIQPTSYNGIGTFRSTGRFDVEGNAMSLLYANDFVEHIDLTLKNSAFCDLFDDCYNLINAENLILPATTLADSCYRRMFYGCSSLTTAPALPATTLASYCYYYMFYGCSSLTTAPALPATTLANYCYQAMFEGCSGLATAPSVLPATTLATSCYYEMFYGCSGLATAPELLATTLASNCYYQMFRDCISLTTAPALPATTLASGCYEYMFYGCTSLTTAPSVLPATTLANSCYSHMFRGCNSLTTAPELPATTLAEFCYQYMFYGCNQLKEITMLATDISAVDCLQNWVNGVAGNGLFYKHADMNGLPSGASGIPEGWEIVEYNADNEDNEDNEDNDYNELLQTPLTFVALEVCEFSFQQKGSGGLIQYSLDNGVTWSKLNEYESVSVGAGDKVLWKALITPGSNGTGTFSSTGRFDVEGNAMSLLYGDDFYNQTGLTVKTYAFYYLFSDCDKLINAENLILPATTVASYCYQFMFSYCAGLTTAPALPATTLAYECYDGIFYGCHSLTTAPALPATTLARRSYRSMFSGCRSLTTAPELPATTLASECYDDMFSNCTGLTTAPALPATTLANYCYGDMFSGCSNLTSAPELPATTLYSNCYFGMFNSCTSLTTAPALPATTLASGCYQYMFRNCTGLTTAPALPATTLANSCYSNMFDGCKQLKEITMLATDISATNCLGSWVNGVAGSGVFYKHPDMNTLPIGMNGIPNGWTVEDYNELAHTPLTFIALENCGFSFQQTGTGVPIQYSLDNGVTWSYLVEYESVSVDTGDRVLWKALITPGSNGIGTFSSTGQFKVKGNPLSLIDGDVSTSNTTLNDSNSIFRGLFEQCDSLVDASEVVLLPVSMGRYCYYEMFYGCRSLQTAPELPATTLAIYCYYGMFKNCTTLATTPVLGAKTLRGYCYSNIFNGCFNLNKITMLATNTTAYNCLTNWTAGVADEGIFIKHLDKKRLNYGVNGIPYNWKVQNDYSRTYVTFVALEACEFSFQQKGAGDPIQYSLDNGVTWSQLNEYESVSVGIGNKVLWKSTIQPASYNGIGTFSSTGRFDAEGNVMSLLYGDDFIGQTDLTGKDYAFRNLFNGCNKLINAENLILPATTLADYCYYFMFYGCSNLTTAPALPATTLASGCYHYMFSNCTGLTTAPALPATTLASYCYTNMFEDCTGLTTAPALPATALTNYCYYQMFQNCTGLTTAPALPATTLAYECYGYMFYGCTSLTTAPELPATTLATECYNQMFYGCRSLTTAPELPATTLADYCYYFMFYGCSSLTSAPALIATTLTIYCYQYMFYGCGNLSKITMLATDISATNCLGSWVNGVAGNGLFYKHPDMNGLPIGVNGIPSGWTVEDYVFS